MEARRAVPWLSQGGVTTAAAKWGTPRAFYVGILLLAVATVCFRWCRCSGPVQMGAAWIGDLNDVALLPTIRAGITRWYAQCHHHGSESAFRAR